MAISIYPRLLALALTLMAGQSQVAVAQAPAPQCVAPTARERVRSGFHDYELVRFTSSNIVSEEPRFAWSVEKGLIHFQRGVTIASRDPVLYQMWRYDPSFSYGVVRSGQSLVFQRVSLSDRSIPEIRLAASPESAGIPDTGRQWLTRRPGTGPRIPGYDFQMAEPLAGARSSYLGLWRRRPGTQGANTLLVSFSPRPNDPRSAAIEIIGRSDLSFALISLTNSIHGYWGFTLLTEASCPQPITMLTYTWYPRWPPQRPD